jgi:hypothetical protein
MPVKERELWIRAPEQAVRLATIVAVYRGSLVVDVEEWQWAKAVVKNSMALLIRSLDKHQREKLEQVDLVERIRDECPTIRDLDFRKVLPQKNRSLPRRNYKPN